MPVLVGSPVARPGMAAAVAAERIKLVSTRAPWWCAGLGAVGTALLGGAVSLATQVEGTGGPPLTVATTQLAYTVGMAVVMVLATLAVTGEYSVGTIRATFLAVPRRGVALVAKAVVVGAVAAVVGLVAGFGAWGWASPSPPGSTWPCAVRSSGARSPASPRSTCWPR